MRSIEQGHWYSNEIEIKACSRCPIYIFAFFYRKETGETFYFQFTYEGNQESKWLNDL